MYNSKLYPLTQKERLLVTLLFNKKITKEDIDILADYIKENTNYKLLLSYLDFQNKWELFSKEKSSQLKMIFDTFHKNNLFMIPWFIDKIKILNRSGIPVMFLKGLALKYYYAKGYPRNMSDFDIAVPEDKYDEAITLLRDKDSLYKNFTSSYHDEIKNNGRIVEVHRWIFKNNGEKKTDIWKRAVNIDFYGTKICVPCPQDMFIHQLDNRSRDFFKGIFLNRKINWLFDCRHIWNFMSDKDKKSLQSRVKEFNVEYNIKFMLSVFCECFPELMDKQELEAMFPDSRKYQMWISLGMKYQSKFMEYEKKYNKKNSLTPLRIYDGFILHMSMYRLFRLERGCGIFNPGFFRYCKEALNINSVGDLWKKYGIRVSFFDKSKS